MCDVKEKKIFTIIYGVFTVSFAIVCYTIYDGFTTLALWSGNINLIVAVLAFWFVCLTKPEATDRNDA